MLKQIVPVRLILVWAILIALSLLGPAVGADTQATTGIVLIIVTFAVVKVRLVGLEFMELRHAPLVMRVLLEAYCIVLWLTLIGLFHWL